MGSIASMQGGESQTGRESTNPAAVGCRDFAIFGHPPRFAEPLQVGRPNVGNQARYLERLTDALDRRSLSNGGVYLQQFEKRLTDVVGARHCIAVCNATIGLQIVVRAAELAGEVIVPSFTFLATAHALAWQNVQPVFADVGPASHNVDPSGVERLITPRTSGILAVHLWGESCAIEALEAIARRHRLKLIYDAAHAFGCSHGGQMIGNFGLAEVFSFHATKFVNAFEGGAIVTNDDALSARMRAMINFGLAGPEDTVTVGTNGKMSEPSAAMGLTNLESLDEFVTLNRRNYQAYADALRGIAGIDVLPVDASERRNYQYVVLEVDPTRAGITRDLLQQFLAAENVMARRYFYPGIHRMAPYANSLSAAPERLPRTEQLCQRVLVLPTGTAVGPDEIAAIATLIRSAVELGPKIAQCLKQPAAEA